MMAQDAILLSPCLPMSTFARHAMLFLRRYAMLRFHSAAPRLHYAFRALCRQPMMLMQPLWYYLRLRHFRQRDLLLRYTRAALPI